MSVKALVLAYDFPPRVAVGGLRPYSWYRYWPEFEVWPVVVTRQWSNRAGYELDYAAASDSPDVLVEEGENRMIIRAPYRPNLSNRLLLKYGPERFRLIRRALTAWFEIGQYYVDIGPRRQLHAAARQYLREHGADVIVATGEPFVLFHFARDLSREFGIPWIADYRDPWSNDPSRPGRRILGPWEARVERHVTSSATAITTVSDFCAEVIGSEVGGRPVEVIPNGFDPEAIAAADDERQGRERLTLAYVGSLYPFYPLESFLRVCEAFVRAPEPPRFALLFVGLPDPAAVQELLAHRYPALAPFVTFHGPLPNDEMAQLLARANAFVAFNNYAYPGTKIFDYLALKRRVLLCYSADPEALELKARHYGYDDAGATDTGIMERLLDETGAGIVVRDADHLRVVLADLYDEFVRSGRVACDSRDIDRFSRRTQAGRIAKLVKEVAA